MRLKIVINETLKLSQMHSLLSVILYSDGTHYFGGYRRAAKQAQPTGMQPYGNLVLHHLTGS